MYEEIIFDHAGRKYIFTRNLVTGDTNLDVLTDQGFVAQIEWDTMDEDLREAMNDAWERAQPPCDDGQGPREDYSTGAAEMDDNA